MKVVVHSSPTFIEDLEKGFVEFSHRLAVLYYTMLIKNITTNKFGFTNKQSTLRRHKGLSAAGKLPLIETGEYIDSIKVEGARVFVAEGVHQGSGISFTELSDILEYGRRDKRIEGFPVWDKTLQEFIPSLNEELKKFTKTI